MSINNAQVLSLVKAIGSKKTVLIKGHMGSGKTDLAHALFADPKYADYHKAIIDCTTLSDGSVSMPDLDRANAMAKELPNERFGISEKNHKGLAGSKPCIIFLDEIGKVSQSVKDFLAPVIYERRIGQYHFPEGSIVFSATNLDQEGLGDEIPAHFRNRVMIVQMRKPTITEWLDWALNNGIDSTLLSAVENTPSVFDEDPKDNPYVYNPDLPVVAFVTHRSLATASALIQTEGIDDDTLQEALEGTIGQPFTVVLNTYRDFGTKIPKVKDVIAGTAAPIGDDQVLQLMFATNVASQRIGPNEAVKDKNEVSAILDYCKAHMSAEIRMMLAHRLSRTKQIAMWVANPSFKDFAPKVV